MEKKAPYIRGFMPYALAAFLIDIVGGFSAVLGPAFVQDIGIPDSNTTWKLWENPPLLRHCMPSGHWRSQNSYVLLQQLSSCRCCPEFTGKKEYPNEIEG